MSDGRKGKRRKRRSEKDSEAEDEAERPRKKRKRRAKAEASGSSEDEVSEDGSSEDEVTEASEASEDEASEDEVEEEPAKKRRKRKRRPKADASDEDDGEGEDDDEEEPAKKRRKRKRRKRSLSEEHDLGGSELISSDVLGIDSEVPSSAGESGSKSVKSLTKELSSTSAKKREGAAHFLGRMGSQARPAVPKLAELLEDEEEKVRLRAARALGKLGPVAVAAVPALVLTLQDGGQDRSRDDKSLAGVAAKSLKRVGPAAWPALLASLIDKSLRRRVARVLRSIPPDSDDGPTQQAFDDLLEPGREKATRAALGVLEKHGAEGIGLILRAAAADDAPELQQRAVEALEEIGKAAVPALAAALEDDDASLRLAAARALTAQAQEVSQRAVARVLGQLEDALLDEDVSVRSQIVDTLSALSDYPQRVQKVLIEAMGDEDPRVSLAAVMGLLDVAEDQEALAEKMTKVVGGGKSAFVRVGACMVLMHLGQDARESVPQLLKAIEDPSTEVREYAHLALQSIRTPSMRVEVIRTASLRLQVLDESEEDSDEGPKVPRRRKRRGAVRRVRRRR